LPERVDGANYQFVDLDSEGLEGILASVNGAWYFKRNSSTNNMVPEVIEDGTLEVPSQSET
jgi:hypothetical protein